MLLSDEIAKETSHMDRITQLQDATDQLVTIMYGSIDYLTKKATFKQVVSSIPITQEIPDSEEPSVFESNKKALVEDLLKKAKQIEYLISALPPAAELEGPRRNEQSKDGMADDLESANEKLDAEFAELEAEMKEVNDEYLTVLKQAEDLQDHLNSTIRSMLDEHYTLTNDLLAH